jgi:peptidoglycan/LPS O-acetylase OafA/YrhL
MRGLAVLIMIQCHTFNSLVRMDLRDGGPYVLSQFVGGMAAPLFLFMAGMTFAFQMDSMERRELLPVRRWVVSLRRAAYILGIAFLFRLSNWAAALPHADWHEITKVDILNCMGVALLAFSAAATLDWRGRARLGAAAGLAIAAAAPLVASLPWDGVPALLREYLTPSGRGHFAFFPCASYAGFGLAAGTLVKRSAEERFDRLMQWGVLLGFGLVFGSQYFSNLPYSVYPQSNFWTTSPALILIRLGVMLLILAGAYIWTNFTAAPRWSWIQVLGKNSLMVYWVHVILVYGGLAEPLKRSLGITQTWVATATVTVLMLALSIAWLRWKAHRAAKLRPAAELAAA